MPARSVSKIREKVAKQCKERRTVRRKNEARMKEKSYAEQRRKLVIEFSGRENVVSRASLNTDDHVRYLPYSLECL